MWIPKIAEYIKDLMADLQSVYSVVDYSYVTIPTYTGGQLAYLLCSKNPVSIIISYNILWLKFEKSYYTLYTCNRWNA